MLLLPFGARMCELPCVNYRSGDIRFRSRKMLRTTDENERGKRNILDFWKSKKFLLLSIREGFTRPFRLAIHQFGMVRLAGLPHLPDLGYRSCASRNERAWVYQFRRHGQ